jgi:hypothetical protein
MRTKELTRGLTREIQASVKGAEELPGTPTVEMAPEGMDMSVESVSKDLQCVECGGPSGVSLLYQYRVWLNNGYAPIVKRLGSPRVDWESISRRLLLRSNLC